MTRGLGLFLFVDSRSAVCFRRPAPALPSSPLRRRHRRASFALARFQGRGVTFRRRRGVSSRATPADPLRPFAAPPSSSPASRDGANRKRNTAPSTPCASLNLCAPARGKRRDGAGRRARARVSEPRLHREPATAAGARKISRGVVTHLERRAPESVEVTQEPVEPGIARGLARRRARALARVVVVLPHAVDARDARTRDRRRGVWSREGCRGFLEITITEEEILIPILPLGATRVREFLFAGRATRPPFPSRHASFARASVRSAALPRSPRSHLVICSSISSRVFPLVSTTVR